jgi:hypothetical protein
VAPGLVWTGAENITSTGIRPPYRPARSESLYRLCYPDQEIHEVCKDYVVDQMRARSDRSAIRRNALISSQKEERQPSESVTEKGCSDRTRPFATLTPEETVLWYHARGLYNVRVALTLRVVSRLDLPLESFA